MKNSWIYHNKKVKKNIFNLKAGVFLFFIGIVFMNFSLYSQDAEISLSVKNTALIEVLKQIEKQSGFFFYFKEADLEAKYVESFEIKNTNITKVLDGALKNTDLEYRIIDKYVVVKKKETASLASVQQERIVTGTITDGTDPLPGVNVIVKGSTAGAVTDIDGKYSIAVPDNKAMLIFSFIGYIAQEVAVNGLSVIDILLNEDTQKLNEVVVVGYGSQKKINVTSAISSVKGDVLLQSPTTNLSNSIVGRLPGLIAVQGNGKPGSSSSISIRGASTFGNNAALVIVDGIERDFQDIDPNEVESISILKDASASSVYGSRAANGVVLVNTKRGSMGKPVFNYNGFSGIQRITRFPEMMDGLGFALTKNQARANMGLSPQYTDQEIEDIRSGKTTQTDWYDLSLNNVAFQTQQNISVNGGTDMMKYFMSLGYLNQDGLYDALNYKRYSIRTNVDAHITKYLTISASIDASSRKRTGSAYSPERIFSDIINSYPLDIPYNPDGSIFYTREQHPLAETEAGYSKGVENFFYTTLSFDQKLPFIQGLSVAGRATFGKEMATTKVYNVPIMMDRQDENGETIELYPVGGYNGKTSLRRSFDEYNSTTLYLSLNYERLLGDHEIKGLFFTEIFDADASDFYAFRTNFPAIGLDELLYGGELEKDSNGGSYEDARCSYVGRINYNYKQKYLLEASIRADGSVAFPKDKKYGFFPAFSAGWRVSEESFWKNTPSLNFFNYLKLRASYGVVGNDRNVYNRDAHGNFRIPTFQYQQVYNPVGSFISGTNTLKTISPGVLPNPDVTWESAAILNVGLDGSMWNNKFAFIIEGFYKRTSDILMSRIRSIPATLGASLPAENYAVVDNQGFEIELTHNNKTGDFNFFVSANASFAKSKVITLDEPANIQDYLIQTGRPLGLITGYKALGLFQSDQEVADYIPQFNGGQKAGDVKYADVNGDGKVDTNDQTIISYDNATPKIIGGLTLGGNYNNFDFSILFQGATKVKKLLDLYATVFFNNGSQNCLAELKDYWTPDNPDATYPRPWEGRHPDNNRNSTLYLRDASYLRLKSIDIGYTIPTKIMSKFGIEKLRFYFTGSNIFTIDKLKIFDPETENTSGQYYPQQQTFNLGVNLIF
jgi:TonB-linked SusC/RagA family outer membrane protein